MTRQRTIGIAAGIGASVLSFLPSGRASPVLATVAALVLALLGGFGASCSGTSFRLSASAVKAGICLLLRPRTLRQEVPPDATGSNRVLYFLLGNGLEIDDALLILHGRAKAKCHYRLSQAEIFKSMTYFAPRFGLLGSILRLNDAVTGLDGDLLVIVWSTLASAAPALFGLALANLVLAPAATGLTAVATQELAAAVTAIERHRHPSGDGRSLSPHDALPVPSARFQSTGLQVAEAS